MTRRSTEKLRRQSQGNELITLHLDSGSRRMNYEEYETPGDQLRNLGTKVMELIYNQRDQLTTRG